MPIYFMSVSPISRCGGSAIATAADRAGDIITDEYLALTYNRTNKTTVDYNTLIGFAGRRSTLWKQAHRAACHPKAIVAREYTVALFPELSPSQNIDLARAFATWLHQRHDIATDVAVHDLNSDLPYASILTTTRVVKDDQFGAKVSLEWNNTQRRQAGLRNKKQDSLEIRAMWATCANRVLSELGVMVSIDPHPLAWFTLSSPQARLRAKLSDVRKADLMYQRAVITKKIARLKAKERRDATACSQPVMPKSITPFTAKSN